MPVRPLQPRGEWVPPVRQQRPPVEQPEPPGSLPPVQTSPAQPEVVQGPVGPQGPQGERGPPGEVSQQQMDQIVQRITSELYSQMQANPQFRGKDGHDGAAGQPGQDGANAEIDVSKLTDEVVQRLPPLTLQFLGTGGTVSQTQTAKLGRTFKIPPMVLSDSEGAVTTKPLGAQFKILAVSPE